MRILLADDHPALRSFVSEVLIDAGHDVVVCEDGTSAWERLNGSSFDVLITDFEMPGLNGLQLYDRLRRTHPELPVLMISSHRADPALAARTSLRCLAKPFQQSELLEALQEIVPSTAGDVSERREIGPRGTPRRRRPSRWPLTLAAAAGLAGLWFMVPVSAPPALPEPTPETTLRSADLTLETPRGVLAELPDDARWQAVPGAALYALRFETVDGRLLFTTTTEQTQWTLPEALRHQLPANVAFLWRVEAFSIDNELMARSPLTRFRVIAPRRDPTETAESRRESGGGHDDIRSPK